MMKCPWQIWLAYVCCLAVAVPAMAWLTHQTLQLDRAETLARLQSELEQDVSEALWRMDSVVTPLLAAESARPHFVYTPYYTPPGVDAATGQPRRVPSPLLAAPSEFVLLNFQIHADGVISSPQRPLADTVNWALDNSGTVTGIATAEERCEQLARVVDRSTLWGQLPEQTLPVVEVGELSLGNGAFVSADNPSVQVINDVAASKVKQQLEELDQQSPAVQPQGDGQQQRGATQVTQGNSAYANNPERQQTKLRRDVNNFDLRSQALQEYAANARRGQFAEFNGAVAPTLKEVREGVSRPLWVREHLLLVRRTTVDAEQLIQGCWLNWPALQERLRREVADFLPQVDFEPVTDPSQVNPSRVLATLPVQLVVPAVELGDMGLTPIRQTLLIAWACLTFGAMAVALLLAGVVQLSERRAAFVAAVTHELRTPLTTFRMYTEMLADDMVADPVQQKSYLNTLRVEADRLSHLVGNVLAYARLERGRRGGREDISLARLLERTQSRLTDRASQAGMQFEIDLSPEAAESVLRTDAAAVEQILFNLVDNAAKYAAGAADARIQLSATRGRNELEIRLRDFGPGLMQKQQRRWFRPFSKTVHEAAHSAPGVGLGLALCQRLARDLGGSLTYEHPPAGACFLLRLPLA